MSSACFRISNHSLIQLSCHFSINLPIYEFTTPAQHENSRVEITDNRLIGVTEVYVSQAHKQQILRLTRVAECSGEGKDDIEQFNSKMLRMFN